MPGCMSSRFPTQRGSVTDATDITIVRMAMYLQFRDSDHVSMASRVACVGVCEVGNAFSSLGHRECGTGPLT